MCSFGKNFMTIGARLKKIRENLGLSQASMATVAKCHKKSWEGYEADNNLPGGEVLSNLAKAGVDINWILTGQANQTENTINIYDVEFSAGCGSIISEENIISSLVVSDDFFEIYSIPRKFAAGVKVRGDSMQPKLFEKDIAILDMSVKQFSNDAMYAFEYDGSCFIKKLQLAGDKLRAISLNPEYAPWDIENEELLHIVGKIKAAICKA